MPFIDELSGKIVVRVVYDGPAMAGKTTNIRELYEAFRGRRSSEIITPDQAGDRTIFMDWLQVDTGLVSGRTLSCHFISVPGQRILVRRRNLLLSLADTVVFVCSAERKALEESRTAYASLIERLEERADAVTVVLQVNKQDHPEAVTEAVIRRELGVAPDVRVLGARATEGIGVRETAVIAIRAAADRVQLLVARGGYESLSDTSADAHELAQRMRHEEERGTPEDATPQPPRVLGPGLPALPVLAPPSGTIWPAEEGRGYIKRALTYPPELDGPSDAPRLRFNAGGWSLWVDRHTVYSDSERARLALLRAVRRSLSLGVLRFPQVTLCLSEYEGKFQLWRVSPGVTSIRETLEYGVKTASVDYLNAQMLGYLNAVAEAHELEASLGLDLGLELSLDAFCLVGDRPYYILEDRLGERTPLVDALLMPVEQLDLPRAVVECYEQAIAETFEAPLSRPILERLQEKLPSGPRAWELGEGTSWS